MIISSLCSENLSTSASAGLIVFFVLILPAGPSRPCCLILSLGVSFRSCFCSFCFFQANVFHVASLIVAPFLCHPVVSFSLSHCYVVACFSGRFIPGFELSLRNFFLPRGFSLAYILRITGQLIATLLVYVIFTLDTILVGQIDVVRHGLLCHYAQTERKAYDCQGGIQFTHDFPQCVVRLIIAGMPRFAHLARSSI